VFEVRNASKAFGGLRAVRDISIKVAQGEILGIIGPNGAGKTTLFNLLNGFLRPDQGQILLEGKDIAGRRPYEICAAGVGRTFQVVRPFRRMSVLDNALVGAYVNAASDSQARAAAEQALGQVGLQDQAQKLAGTLSNKQLRLLEIARALAGKPRLLLLDETLAWPGRWRSRGSHCRGAQTCRARHHHRHHRAHDAGNGASRGPLRRTQRRRAAGRRTAAGHHA
jgi:branched-chain amino acid transport system permease protein